MEKIPLTGKKVSGADFDYYMYASGRYTWHLPVITATTASSLISITLVCCSWSSINIRFLLIVFHMFTTPTRACFLMMMSEKEQKRDSPVHASPIYKPLFQRTVVLAFYLLILLFTRCIVSLFFLTCNFFLLKLLI